MILLLINLILMIKLNNKIIFLKKFLRFKIINNIESKSHSNQYGTILKSYEHHNTIKVTS